ncbi:transcription initiation factor TFIID subunit 1 [Trichogramma pretiosum]|uniref:transcription initiation factor TFIID subunit 1 n=1 Tax=Trichogramma pretiosum TaxID=7493 RepID=UPI0006C9CECB|nr:transcription initiation factor TFIID subunit 1 [Trichogramma pretiosum]
MADSDDDNDQDYNDLMSSGSLAGFMFGNIDVNGELEDDNVLDSEAKEHLESLCHLGLGSLIQEMMPDESNKRENGDKRDDKGGSSQQNGDLSSEEDYDEDYDGDKDPSAKDFSDINELADEAIEESQTKAEDSAAKNEMSENTQKDIKTENTDGSEISQRINDAEKIEPSIKKECADTVKQEINQNKDNSGGDEKMEVDNDNKENEYDADDEDHKGDSKLMPPPPVPEEKEILTAEEEEAIQKRKLETPLASMLPSKYANVDVTELFPDFRPGKVLRFSKLFGPGKPSSLPHYWRTVRKRRRKQKILEGSKDSDSGSGSDSRSRFRGWVMNYGPDPTPDQLASDDEDKLLKPVDTPVEVQHGTNGDTDNMGPKVADWRFGPAQIWYDILDVPETGEGFNYGFKLAEKVEEQPPVKEDLPDDAFLMVSQLHWEDEVIWDGDDIKHKTRQKLNSKDTPAGWVPSSDNRTAQSAFSQPGKGTPIAQNVRLSTSQISTPLSMQGQKNKLNSKEQDHQDDTWYSIFPVENEELVYGSWEDEIIWDAENMKKIPKPKILTLDPNDENIILGIPDDIDPALLHKNNGPQPKVKIPHPHVKKSKLLLGKAGVINVLEEDAPPPPPKSPSRDPFNISNDEYYMPKSSETTLKFKVGGGNLIQHSTPVVELAHPFVRTFVGPVRLRSLHRPPMRRYNTGKLSRNEMHGVLPLIKYIKKKAKQREAERIASGGGDVFFMRTADDLSGRDGEIVLVEFSEEYPPLMNLVGMCSKMKNYYKRKAGKDTGPPTYKYGETAYAYTSPFLGILAPGQSIQAMENNLYRAPIYEHNIPQTDFLVIRTRNDYFIREIDALFVAGQECPLYEVPGPNSKRANNFVRDFLQVFIYRLFWKSKDTPRRIKMEVIKKAFPMHSESSIRKRLKICADFKRTGMDSNWWVIKPDFRLPTEEEIRAVISPEQCCAYYSMIAAQQRLKDAGYGEKSIFATQDDEDEEQQLKLDDEIKAAPWYTTRAYIQAMKGKCLLQLSGPADPTGCGEGFSYIRMPNKPTVSKEEQEAQPKRIVTGTDADLRRLNLKDAKNLLRKFDLPEEDIKKLSRWEVIDVVRTLSTEKAKAGEEGMTKFSRGNRFSIAEHQERYKEDCQRIFDLQNKVLASSEVLSTDEGESSDADSSDDIEEMGKNIENLLNNKKTSTQLSLEREEQQRQELRKMMLMGDGPGLQEDSKLKGKKKDDENNSTSNYNSQRGRILKIVRTYRHSDGQEYTRTETVRTAAVIDAYLKIKNSKDETFVKQFVMPDESQKEEIKREKRRLQEQLRRLRRNQERERMLNSANQTQNSLQSGLLLGNGNNSSQGSTGAFPSQTLLDRSNASSPVSANASTMNASTQGGFPQTPTTPVSLSNHPSKIVKSEHHSSPSRRKKAKLKPDLKLKCGACGQVGHMRTNKACPQYQYSMANDKSMMGMSQMEMDEQEIDIKPIINTEEQDLVNIEGLKVKLAPKLIRQAEEESRKRNLSNLRIPRDVVGQGSGRKRKRGNGSDTNDIYLKRYQKPGSANRRRTDPVVVLSTILEEIVNVMREQKEYLPFAFPVNSKLVPDYHRIVGRPMDLQTIRENLRQKKYQSREAFLADVLLIKDNCTLYNGPKHPLTHTAQKMLDFCVSEIKQKEDRLMRLEKAINPLLDDNDQVALSFILNTVINDRLKLMSEATQFLKPVNKKVVKDYYDKIQNPIDLETIQKNVEAHKYQSRKEFLNDIQQILINCRIYNGESSSLTKNAEAVVKAAQDYLDQYGTEHVIEMERRISQAQQRAFEQAGIDSSWIGEGGEDENYTIAESDSRGQTSHLSSPEHSFGKPMDTYDFVDVVNEVELSGPKATKKDVLEEDLQFSSEDEFDEVPFGTTDDFDATELKPLQPVQVPVEDLPGDHDSHQVAEAMIQLGNAGSYHAETSIIPPAVAEESIDSNYDPSDSFFTTLSVRKEEDIVSKIQDDLAMSDSDEEDQKDIKELQPAQMSTEEEVGSLWF